MNVHRNLLEMFIAICFLIVFKHLTKMCLSIRKMKTASVEVGAGGSGSRSLVIVEVIVIVEVGAGACTRSRSRSRKHSSGSGDGSSALTVAGRSVTTAIACCHDYSNNSMISSDRDCSGLGDDGSSSSSYCSNHYGADRRY